jgi:hypothetical protein
MSKGVKEKLQKYPEKMFPLKLAKEYGFQHLLISTVM